MIWHQAMTGSFLDGRAFGWNKTVTFSIEAPMSDSQLHEQRTSGHADHNA